MKNTLLLALACTLTLPLAAQDKAEKADKPAKRATAPAKTIQADAKRDLAKIFDGKLVDADGKPVKTEALAKADYTLVYFSAHWCPPCRAFTPKLVEFTKKHRKDGNFEVVFVSSDRDEKAMLGYMKDTGMSWGGVLSKGADLQDLSAGLVGIPTLRLFDKEGKLVTDSVVDGRYRGPDYVLGELEKKLK